jgi:bromodomain-containing protein 7
VLDPLTEGRHCVLRKVAEELISRSRGPVKHDPMLVDDKERERITAQVTASLAVYPTAIQSLQTLYHINSNKIDMAALIKTPEELFISEEAWAGKKVVNATSSDAPQPEMTIKSENEDENSMDVDISAVNGSSGPSSPPDGTDELSYTLSYAAGVISNLDQRLRSDGVLNGHPIHAGGDDRKGKEDADDAGVGIEGSGQSEEDPALHDLRLNLLALAKRAPLDTIAQIPSEFVPAHIRHIIPHLGPAVQNANIST